MAAMLAEPHLVLDYEFPLGKEQEAVQESKAPVQAALLPTQEFVFPSLSLDAVAQQPFSSIGIKGMRGSNTRGMSRSVSEMSFRSSTAQQLDAPLEGVCLRLACVSVCVCAHLGGCLRVCASAQRASMPVDLHEDSD